MDLAHYRKKHNLSMSALGSKLGISKGHLCDIISRKRQPSLPLAVKISEATGVPVASLLKADA